MATPPAAVARVACALRREGGSSSLQLSDEIALADLHAAVTEDGVGSGDVEEEVRQCVVQKVRLTGHHLLDPADFELDLARLGAVELLGLERLDEGDGLVD